LDRFLLTSFDWLIDSCCSSAQRKQRQLAEDTGSGGSKELGKKGKHMNLTANPKWQHDDAEWEGGSLARKNG
jgi:hypothetical protein